MSGSTIGMVDLASYLATLRFRGVSPTIMVEGTDDKRTISRTLLEFMKDQSELKRIVLDTAEYVHVDGFPGNRARVEEIQRAAHEDGLNLHSLVDREFRSFEIAPNLVDNCCSGHVVTTDGVTWTRGHSLENYFLESELYTAFVHYRWPEKVSLEMCERAFASWDTVIRASAAISWCFFETGVLERMRGGLRFGVWSEAIGGIALDFDEISLSLESRGIVADKIGIITARIRVLNTTA